MLTEIEMRMLSLVYFICSKSPTVPSVFKDGRMFLKSNSWIYLIKQLIAFLVLVSVMVLKLMKFPDIIRQRNFTGLIIHGFALTIATALAVCKLNIWLYKGEMITVINQVLSVNSVWGKVLSFEDF